MTLIPNAIYASTTVSMTELRRNPGAIIEEAGSGAIAILNRNRATAYLVPAVAFEALIDKLEDLELAAVVRKRRGGHTVKVALEDI